MLMTGGATTCGRRDPHGIPQRTIDRAPARPGLSTNQGSFFMRHHLQEGFASPGLSIFLVYPLFHGKCGSQQDLASLKNAKNG
jgi:hypothetical protein